ncbi:MAG: PaaI family thioesterase [Actinomycetota bacterium]
MRQEIEELPGGDGLGELIGIEYQDSEADEVRARVEVGDHIRQPFGIVHGGVYAVLAESICSAATWLAVHGDGMAAMGQSNGATFLRPITEGHVNAVARPRHRGRTTWVWDVEMSDDQGRTCALVRMTVAVRPIPGSGS